MGRAFPETTGNALVLQHALGQEMHTMQERTTE